MSLEEMEALLLVLAVVTTGGKYQLEDGVITQVTPPTAQNVAAPEGS